MGKVLNMIILYDEWLKEVMVNLTAHSHRAGDTVPPVLVNFPTHLLAPKLAWVNGGNTNERQISWNDTHQGQASAGTVLDRARGESKRV
jgi:hypothetical protein